MTLVGARDVVRDLLAGAGLTEASPIRSTSRLAMARLLLGTQGNEETLLLAPAGCRRGRAGERRDAQACGSGPGSGTAPGGGDCRAVARDHAAQSASVETEALRLTLMPGLAAHAAQERQA